MMNDLTKLENENQEQYIYRVNCLIKEGKYKNWAEVTPIVNKELFGEDFSKYKGESAWRKDVASGIKYYENVFAKKENDEYIDELKKAKLELELEKVKFRDERNALRANQRDLGRNYADYDILRRLIVESSEVQLNHIVATESDNDLFICLSDLHIGGTNESNFGSYNSDIAKERLEEYLSEIIKIQKTHNSQDCYVGLLGDLINSSLHLTLKITNRENVIEQLKIAAELLSSFVKELSKVFAHVYVANVAGNHTRIGKKDECLRDERTDDLIPWYMEAKLENYKNVSFIKEKYDPTIANVTIRGKEYLMVHGDFDSFSETGVNKLVAMTRTFPQGIFYGHMHKCSYDYVASTQIVRSGSFSSTGDDYCISKRIRGNASQMVCVCTEDGIKTCYPVHLD